MADDGKKAELDRPSETAQKGVPGIGEGASAQHYLRDVDNPQAEHPDGPDAETGTPDGDGTDRD